MAIFGFRFVMVMCLVSCLSLVVGAQVNHVVGGDRGWDSDSGVGSWSSGRIFTVGDTLWFTYSAAQETIIELKTQQEYESCDVTNPIKMYTDGINSLLLHKQGLRYFTSSNFNNCKNGLKIHVDVKPPKSPWESQVVAMSEDSAIAMAETPESPSSSSNLKVDLGKVGGVLVSLFGVWYAFVM